MHPNTQDLQLKANLYVLSCKSIEKQHSVATSKEHQSFPLSLIGVAKLTETFPEQRASSFTSVEIPKEYKIQTGGENK